VQRGVDQLVRDVRPVVLGRIDVVDAELGSPPEHRQRRLPVPRRAEDARAGELHRAEADATDRRPGENAVFARHAMFLPPQGGDEREVALRLG
jgi:hypothetical protein